MNRQFWANSYARGTLEEVGPFDSPDEAAAAFFGTYPAAKECCVGYGTYGPHFDIHWQRNPNWKPAE